MKRASAIIIICISFLACRNHTGPYHPELIIQKGDGLIIAKAVDTFEVYNGRYHVFTLVKNASKKQISIARVTAKYCDEKGKELALSVSTPNRILKVGDSAIVDNQYLFPTINGLIYKVKLSVSDALK